MSQVSSPGSLGVRLGFEVTRLRQGVDESSPINTTLYDATLYCILYCTHTLETSAFRRSARVECVCVYMYIYIYIYTYICMYVCMYVCMYIYIYIYIRVGVVDAIVVILL